MEKWVLNECLQQLIKVYALAGQQFIYAANESRAPVLKKFYEQRAFERTEFIDDVRFTAYGNENSHQLQLTTEQLFENHTELYGENVLGSLLITDIDSLVIDEKALEICQCLVDDGLPENLSQLLKAQFFKIESGMISMAYLKAEHGYEVGG